MEDALHQLELPEQEVRRIAAESKGRLSAVLRCLDKEQDDLPSWAREEAPWRLVPLLMAGQWNDLNEKDQEAVAALANCSYENVRETVAAWTGLEGPLVRQDAVVDWLAWDLAWDYLAPSIDPAHLERFHEVCQAVLSEADPKFELEPDQRWAAPLYEKTHPYSIELRAGLVGSLVQLALHDEQIPSQNGQAIADGIVRTLLSGEKFNRTETWRSLAHWLPDMAEAAPDAFLETTEKLSRDEKAVAALFEDPGMFGPNPHVPLLWALERLAWAPAYLPQAVLALGRLATLDPGGRLSNRPKNSLREILLPWHPQTAASEEHRVAVLERLYQEWQSIGWEVAISLLPSTHRVASGTVSPAWRDWKPAQSPSVTVAEYWAAVEAVVDLVLQWAPEDGRRWEGIADVYGQIRGRHPELADRLLQSLENLDADTLEKEARIGVAERVRRLIARHRQHPDASWSMAEEEIQRLDHLYDQVAPTLPSDRWRWLFTSWPESHRLPELSFEERGRRLNADRVEAVQEVLSQEGLSGILALADHVEVPYAVGYALAKSAEASALQYEALREVLVLEPQDDGATPPRLQLALGFVGSAFDEGGLEWVDAVAAAEEVGWDSTKYANFAWGLPANQDVWRRLSVWDPAAATQYWSRVPVGTRFDAKSDVEYVARQLLDAGRPYRAIEILWDSMRFASNEAAEERLPASDDLVIAALEAAPQVNPEDEWFCPALTIIAHAVEELLDAMEESGASRDTLARLEWIWLPALEDSRRGPRVLQRAISTDPALFNEVLACVFLAEGEVALEPTEAQRTQAMQAYRLLEKWTRLPGSSETQHSDASEDPSDTHGVSINYEELLAWTQEARRIAESRGRLRVCDSQIGHLLAHSPPDPDGAWPCEAVCKLLEAVSSAEIEHGFEIGIYNLRGVHVRQPGGDQERELAATYRDYMQQIQHQYPRTSACLRRVADAYEEEAKRFDKRAEREEFQ